MWKYHSELQYHVFSASAVFGLTGAVSTGFAAALAAAYGKKGAHMLWKAAAAVVATAVVASTVAAKYAEPMARPHG